MRSKIRWWLALLAVIAVASLATAPTESGRSLEPLLLGAQIDPHVLSIIQRSCHDCHSEATRYPWYSYVAPVSFLIRHDVLEGRRHLNLSRWQEYSLVRKQRSLSEIANQVKDREMPLREYTWFHPDAKLSDSDVDALFRWTQTERARLIAAGPR